MRRLILLVVGLLWLQGAEAQVLIGISKENPAGNYGAWIENICADCEVINLSGMRPDSLKRTMALLNGVLMSGGEDIHPRRYGKLENLPKCGEINESRDSLEYKILKQALKAKLPVLGICRGAQWINVIHGGTLVADIPTDVQEAKWHRGKALEARHAVRLVKASRLSGWVGQDTGTVNSAHHQCAGEIGKGLRVAALAPDGVVEALEAKDTDGPFILGVQWHPERMDWKSPYSKRVGEAFIRASRLSRPQQ